jgi:formylglycine-generating enzyme required for sulfatase activity
MVPKVADFGLAKRTDTSANLSQSGAVIGTPAYMAPEQAAGQVRDVGPAADVYALGAILYQCFAGRPPFQGATPFETIRLVLNEEPVPPSRLNAKVPRDLETICLKCLHKQPALRYDSAEALAEDLRRYRDGEPILARPVGAAERAIKWVRRKPAAAGLLAAAAALVAVIVVSLVVVTSQLQQKKEALGAKETEEQARRKAEQDRALSRVIALGDAAPGAVPGLLAELEATREEVLPRLRDLWADKAGGDPGRRMRVGLALLPVEPDAVRDELADWPLRVADPAEAILFRDVLARHAPELRERFWEKAVDKTASQEERFRAFAALAGFDPAGDRWTPDAGREIVQVMTSTPRNLETWARALRPIAGRLLAPLSEVYRTGKPSERREYAATVLAEYAADQPALIADLLLDADSRGQFDLLFAALRRDPDRAAKRIRDELAIPTPDPDAAVTPEKAAARDRLARRQATGAVTLLNLGMADGAWPLFRSRPDPEARSQLIYRAALLGVDPNLLIRRLPDEPDVSARRALVLTLGEFNGAQIPEETRRPLTEMLLKWYRDDPDAGLHAAIDWLLGHPREGSQPRPLNWRQAAALRKIDNEVKGRGPEPGRGWYVNRHGLTMVCLRDPAVFRMGSPEGEPGRDLNANETPHRRAIGRNFALAAHPVTNREFEEFRKTARANMLLLDSARWSPSPDGPVIAVSWFEAALYCNFLSKKDGLPESEWCYPQDLQVGMKPFPNYLERKGYRLPTEAEWEYACRAGTGSSRYYGNSKELLPRYAWFTLNSDNHAWPVGEKRPNDFGFFDMHGNVFNWMHEATFPYRPRGGAPTPDTPDRSEVRPVPGRGTRGGSFVYPADEIRSAYRLHNDPRTYNNMNGFRPARTLP